MHITRLLPHKNHNHFVSLTSSDWISNDRAKARHSYVQLGPEYAVGSSQREEERPRGMLVVAEDRWEAL